MKKGTEKPNVFNTFQYSTKCFDPPEFDLANNTREYLLDHFSIEEGKTALEKARINKRVYDELVSYGG